MRAIPAPRPILALMLALVLALVALPARAQDQPATLIADRVAVVGQDMLEARGNVEVFFQGRRLRASRIAYDRGADRLTIEGPILLSDGTGSYVLADQAELSADLSDGVLRSARLVLNQQLQLAASELQRIGGRYNRLGRTVASACRVCAENATPLWEVRARSVLHDVEGRQIYFDRAQLRFGGVPVLFLPRLRVPDPTLKRATGFLMPELRSSSGLGPGVRLPYFIVLGPSRDLTLTPFLSAKSAQTLEFRYREAFRTGRIDLEGALSQDKLRPGGPRGHAVLNGDFTLPRDFALRFRAEQVSDPAYLADYGISDSDRLTSRIEVTRTRRNEYITGRLIHLNSIRAGEANARLPSVIGDLTWQRRFRPAVIGGTGGLMFQAHGHYRSSDSPFDTDGDGLADGRDVVRATIRGDWRRDAVIGPGVQVTALAEVAADLYRIRQDASAEGTVARTTGAAGIELRWPLVRHEASGGRQVIEPVVQLVWAPRRVTTLPNEDSTLNEFDEGNLFALHRFAGNDAVERGPRANLGIGWTRVAPSGATLGVTLGRVVRLVDEPAFGLTSGLSGKRSDWLATMSYAAGEGLVITGRAAIAQNFALTKGEVRIDLQRDRYGLATSYVWMKADPAEARADRVSELLLDARYGLTDFWTAQLATRYDFTANRAASAGLRLAYRNECMKVDLSLSRRYTSSTSVAARTDVGLSVELLGFGGATAPGPARACRG